MAGIHPTAIVADGAQLGADVTIGPYCVVGPKVRLGDGVALVSHVCIDGITANKDACRNFVERSIGIVTALNPLIGYERATEIAAEALASGRGVVELVRERTWVTNKQLRDALSPANLTGTAR